MTLRKLMPLALALALGSTAGAATAQEAPDAARMWDTFLAKANAEQVTQALGVLDDVGYTLNAVDAGKCREHAKALLQAQAQAPVSFAVQRAVLLCAEATGDQAAAERATTTIAALARQAFRDADRGAWPRPVRIVAPADAYALLASAGLEFRYEMYNQLRPAPYFPLMVAAAPAGGDGPERVLQFDYVDVLQAIDRQDPSHGTPRLRLTYADAFVEGAAKRGEIVAVDLQAVKDAVGEDGAPARVAALKNAALDGGLHAASTWLAVCSATPFKGCADGLVDALLPQAEAHHAYATMLLAAAYHEGVGVARDQKAVEAMLDAADRRWEHRGASPAFAQMLGLLHPGQPLPPFLRKRLEDSASAGHPAARVMALAIDIGRSDGKYVLTPADEALLADPAHNGIGQGLMVLASWYDSRDKAKSGDYLRRAADANNSTALRMLAMRMRDALGSRPATPELIALLEKAANGGDVTAMRYLAWRTWSEGNPRRAEDWVVPAAAQGDVDALFLLASLWAGGYKDMSGDLERSVALYQSLAEVPGEGARARRALSAMARLGKGMPKDLAKARELLAKDAEAGDVESQGMLGGLLMTDALGPPDEAAGRKWLERAIAAGSVDAMNQYGLWLHNHGHGAADRARGVQLSRQAADKDDEEALNNFAWMLCTSEYEDVRKPADGMAYTRKLEAIPDLDPGTVDTVAACYAAAGQYPHAVELQEQVIASMRKAPEPDEDNIKEMQARLALYRAGKPYIEQQSD